MKIITPEEVNRQIHNAEANADNEATEERDAAEKAIVGAIAALAMKYGAVDELKQMQDITIPALHELAISKGVPEAEYGALIMELTPYKWQLEAVTGQTWAECWSGLKSRFFTWMEQINANA